MAQTVKNSTAMQETWVQSLGQEDPREKEMAPHSRTLAWKIPWMEDPGRLQSMGSQSWTRLSNFTGSQGKYFTFKHSCQGRKGTNLCRSGNFEED